MSEPRNNLLARWFEEVWNKGRLEAVDEMAAPDVIAHGLVDAQGNEIAGIDAFKAFWHQFRSALPDIHVEIEDELIEGDKMLVRCTVRGTHGGDGIGAAATQKKVVFSGMCLGRFKDGKLVEAWDNFDFLKMYQQVGVVPASFA